LYAINPLSTDVIASLDDRELDSRFRDVQRAINKVKNPRKRIELEEEFCYLYRERESRFKRIQLHKDYLASLQRSDNNNQGEN
jgi:hypothetical protein